MLAHLPGVDAGKVAFGTHQLPAWEYTMIDHTVYSQLVLRGAPVLAIIALLLLPCVLLFSEA